LAPGFTGTVNYYNSYDKRYVFNNGIPVQRKPSMGRQEEKVRSTAAAEAATAAIASSLVTRQARQGSQSSAAAASGNDTIMVSARVPFGNGRDAPVASIPTTASMASIQATPFKKILPMTASFRTAAAAGAGAAGVTPATLHMVMCGSSSSSSSSSLSGSACSSPRSHYSYTSTSTDSSSSTSAAASVSSSEEVEAGLVVIKGPKESGGGVRNNEVAGKSLSDADKGLAPMIPNST
jgi:hypothetical protein